MKSFAEELATARRFAASPRFTALAVLCLGVSLGLAEVPVAMNLDASGQAVGPRVRTTLALLLAAAGLVLAIALVITVNLLVARSRQPRAGAPGGACGSAVGPAMTSRV